MHQPATMDEIFAILSDRRSRNILKMAYGGMKATGLNYSGNMSKKQFYTRLARLRDAGLIEKNSSYYRSTTLGSLVYNNHVKIMDEILAGRSSLRAIDVIKADKQIPLDQKERIINDLLDGCDLRGIANSTHLSGFMIIKDFKHLVNEVMKVLDNAKDELYFASRYYDPHASAKIAALFSKGVSINLLDGNPGQSNLESRLNAILRTPPSREAFDEVSAMTRSPKFSLRNCDIPLSFLVVDGRQVVQEVVSCVNPQEFTTGIASYDDPYLASTFVKYFNSLSARAMVPKWLVNVPRK